LNGSEWVSIWFLSHGTSPPWTRNFLLDTFQRFSFHTSTNSIFYTQSGTCVIQDLGE
jgi:hypothetical protein